MCGSWLMAQGSWLMAHGQGGPARPPGPWGVPGLLAVDLAAFFACASQSGSLILAVCSITKGGWKKNLCP